MWNQRRKRSRVDNNHRARKQRKADKVEFEGESRRRQRKIPLHPHQWQWQRQWWHLQMFSKVWADVFMITFVLLLILMMISNFAVAFDVRRGGSLGAGSVGVGVFFEEDKLCWARLFVIEFFSWSSCLFMFFSFSSFSLSSSSNSWSSVLSSFVLALVMSLILFFVREG